MDRKLVVCVVLFVMVICCCLLIYFGVTVTKPYIITSAYATANCMAVNVTSHGYSECTCNTGDEEDVCRSAFPCKEITVIFNTSLSSPPHKSRLFQYYNAGYKKETCSMWTCDESPATNEWRISQFVASYGNTDGNSTYTCFYNPENPDEVIVEKTSRTAMMLGMYIPTSICLFCVFVLLLCCCQYCVKHQRSRNNLYSI